jgi:hypothetical protein
MANFKRRKSRRTVRCTLCTQAVDGELEAPQKGEGFVGEGGGDERNAGCGRLKRR